MSVIPSAPAPAQASVAPAPAAAAAPTAGATAAFDQFAAAQALSAEEQRKAAMLAMEGEEGRRKRELEEQYKREQELRSKLEFEKSQFESKLREITKQKESLELEWIKYSNQKQPLETQVQPIKAEEKAAEDEERKTEQDEAIAASTPNTPVATIQEVEMKRWAIQERRHHAEEQKWAFEKQIELLKSSMDALGNEYRRILNDEDSMKKTIRDSEAALKNLSSQKPLA